MAIMMPTETQFDTRSPKTLRPSKILILSSHSHPSLSSPINHQLYAERHGYDYLFDVTPYPLKSSYDQKLQALIHNLRRANCEWIMWIDEDAYFMDHSIRLESFLPVDNRVQFVICRSPVNPEGGWSMINSGVFFVKRCSDALQLLIDALHTDDDLVASWWNEDKYGLFIPGGDQERMLYLFLQRGMVGTSVLINDHAAFNSRAYHFHRRFDERFVCHLASHGDKSIPLDQMRQRFGLDRFLLPQGSGVRLENFRYSIFFRETKAAASTRPRRLYARIRNKVARLINRIFHRTPSAG